MSEIKVILEAFKTLLDNNLTLKSYGLKGEIDENHFTFNEPATEEQIVALEKGLGIVIPHDYRELLLLHNGMLLFSNDLSELEFYDINKVKEEYVNYQTFIKAHNIDGDKGDYPIGRYPDVGQIMILSKKVKKKSSKGALVVGEVDKEQTKVSLTDFIDNELATPLSFFWERI